eukprot:6121011-Pyramimonas_sp.AAC.1
MALSFPGRFRGPLSPRALRDRCAEEKQTVQGASPVWLRHCDFSRRRISGSPRPSPFSNVLLLVLLVLLERRLPPE